MSVTHVHTASLHGSRVMPVTIEVDIQRGLPLFSIIGLPDKQIEEAKERVKAAIKNSGFSFPLGKITVNLSPSFIKKQGTGFDLGIALGILAASRVIPTLPEKVWVLGELSLAGSVLATQHLLTLLMAVEQCSSKGCIISHTQIEQAALVKGCPILAVHSLREVVGLLQKPSLTFSSPKKPTTVQPKVAKYALDQITGQYQAKRALAIALASRSSILLTGPAGAGKSMLAKASHELLPPLSGNELLTVAQLHSYSGYSYSFANPQPPFRAPLPSVSRTALLGGGRPLVPGEVSLAHHGVLFLDEFPEMKREVRDALRLPMQEKKVEHVRDGVQYLFPAHCSIIAAQNPCPCGLRGVKGEKCRCTAGEIQRYRSALSEPILDRFDLFCDVPRLDSKEWQKEKPLPKELSGAYLSAQIKRALQIKKSPALSKEAEQFLLKAVDTLKLSGRSLQSVRNVARTIASMEGVSKVGVTEVSEALQYRKHPF